MKTNKLIFKDEPTLGNIKTVDDILPYLILFSSILLLIFLLVRGAVHAPLFLIFVVGGSSLYIFLNKRGFFQRSNDLPTYRTNKLALIIFFFIFLSLSFLLLSDEPYVKSIYYFLCVSIMAVCIGVQVLRKGCFEKVDVYVILSQIFILSIILRFSSFLIAPPFIGSGDIWYGYYVFDSQLLHSGHIPPGLWYSDFPISNLVTSIFKEVTFHHPIMHIIPIFLFASFCCVFIFIIGRKLIGVKAGLLAALIFTTMPHMINWASEPNPMTLSIVLLLFGIYLYFNKRESSRFNIIMFIIFLIVLILDVLCHTLGSLVFLLFILSDLGAQISVNFFKKDGRQRIFYSTVLIAVVILIGYWMYVAKTFFINIAEFIIGHRSYPHFLAEIHPIASSPVSDIFINRLGIFIIFFFSIVGGLLLFRARSRSRYTIIYICGFLYLLQLILASEIVSIGTVPYRLDVFLQAIIPIPFALGFVTLFNKIRARKKLVSFSIIILILCFFLVASQDTGDESAPFKTTGLSQVTYSELTMMNLVDKVVLPTDRTIFTDLITGRILASNSIAINIPHNYTKAYSEDNIEQNGYFLVSLRSIQKGTSLPVEGVKGAYVYKILTLQFLGKIHEHHNKIYDSRGGQIYC